MDNNLPPAQRKRARLAAQRTAQTSPQPSENTHDLTLSEDEMTMEQLWHKWETDPTPLTPEEEEDIARDRAMLAEIQKTDPDVGHVHTLRYEPRMATPEELAELRRSLMKE